jgi:YHS domain-containing protein
MAIDPVGKMEIDENSSSKSIVEGKEFFFCCPKCKLIYDKNPSNYS